MTSLSKPASRHSWPVRVLTTLLVVPVVAVLGVGLGLGLTSEASPLLVSAVFMLGHLIVLIVAPWPGLLLWLLAYPFAETRLNIPLGAGIADLSWTRLVAAASLLLLLAQVTIGRRQLRVTKLDVCALLFVAGMGLSVATSPALVRSLQVTVDAYLIPLLVYYVGKHLVTRRQDVERLFSIVLIVGAYSAFFAIQEQLTGRILLNSDASTLLEYAGGQRILRSLWGNNGIFGTMFAMAIPVAVYRLLLSKSAPRRAGYGLLLAVLLVSMFLTYKRVSWVALAASFAVMAAFWPAFRPLFLVLVLVASVPLALFWDRLADSDLVEQRVLYNVGTLNGRTDRWQAGVALWARSPLLGHGFRTYDQISGFQAVHSFYLHILVSAGLMGFLPFVAFMLLALGRSAQLFLRGPTWPAVFVNRPMVVVFWATLLGYMIKAISENQVAPENSLIFILVGALVGSQEHLSGPAPVAVEESQP
jgi:O-antigen ligase